jgi:hypothetical protein
VAALQEGNNSAVSISIHSYVHPLHCGRVPQGLGIGRFRKADGAAGELSLTRFLVGKNWGTVVELGLGIGKGVAALLC